MDESKKYIEMSLAAISYFGLKPPEPMDYIALETSVGSGKFDVISGLQFWQRLGSNVDPLTTNRQWVRLLRQDQLLEIWMKHPEKHPDDATFEAKMDAFIHWLWGGTFRHNFYPPQYLNFASMEQLGLAFMIKEKCNKTWNGKDWVNGS